MEKYIETYLETYQSFPKLNNVKLLWHNGYWDGPINGVCNVDGNKCWYERIEDWNDKNQYPHEDDLSYGDFSPPWNRRYLVHKLSKKQYETILARHLKFNSMVGGHCDYDEDGKRTAFHYNDKITPATSNQYYQEQKREEPYDPSPESEDLIIGWFEE